jgi:hypothetical protein
MIFETKINKQEERNKFDVDDVVISSNGAIFKIVTVYNVCTIYADFIYLIRQLTSPYSNLLMGENHLKAIPLTRYVFIEKTEKLKLFVNPITGNINTKYSPDFQKDYFL